jgi:hypothetical protein
MAWLPFGIWRASSALVFHRVWARSDCGRRWGSRFAMTSALAVCRFYAISAYSISRGADPYRANPTRYRLGNIYSVQEDGASDSRSQASQNAGTKQSDVSHLVVRALIECTSGSKLDALYRSDPELFGPELDNLLDSLCEGGLATGTTIRIQILLTNLCDLVADIGVS